MLLLTGGTGFLGKYLLNELSKEYEIRLLTRNPDYVPSKGIIPIKTDLAHSRTIDRSIFDDVDIFVHSAAKVGNWPKNPQKGYYQVNVEATRNLLELAISCNVNKIIYTSSFFALGETGESIADESWDVHPSYRHPYINTKYEAGKIVDEFSKQYPITQLLPTTIVGPGIDNPISNVIIDYINRRLPGVPGGGRNYLNFVAVSDVAKAYSLAIESDLKGKYIIGGTNMTLSDFISLFSDRLGLNAPRPLPFWSATLYACLLELIRYPKITVADINTSKRNFRYSSEKAMKELNYSITPVEKLIDEMIVSFYRENRLNKNGKGIVQNSGIKL